MFEDIEKKYKTIRAKIILYSKGFFMGSADIIPGVSGGTIALISGIYEHFIYALSSLRFKQIQAIFLYIIKREQQYKQEIRSIPFTFLIVLIAGISTGIISMSRIIPFFMDHYPFYTYSLFFGLITFSISIPYKKMNHSWKEFLIMILFAILLFFITSFNPYANTKIMITLNSNSKTIPVNDSGKFHFYLFQKDFKTNIQIRVVKENHIQLQTKIFNLDKEYLYTQNRNLSLFLRFHKENSQILIKGNIAYQQTLFFSNTNMGRYIWIFLVASIAICAMILPGISGAYILVLFGEYQNILKALYEKELNIIVTFIAGIIVGILSFVRLLQYLLKKYHSYTMSALTGFLIGSLNKIFPFRYLSHSPTTGEIIIAILIGCTGALFLYGLEILSRRIGDPEPPI